MNDLNRFNIPKHFIIDWDHVERVMRERNSPMDRDNLDRYFQKHPGGAGGTTTASSTSGTVPVRQVPAVHEQWWVKAPNRDRLYLVNIRKISSAIVEITVEGQTIDGLRSGCYERDYLKFVEQHVQPGLEPKSV
jgi:hypothetical protein